MKLFSHFFFCLLTTWWISSAKAAGFQEGGDAKSQLSMKDRLALFGGKAKAQAVPNPMNGGGLTPGFMRKAGGFGTEPEATRGSASAPSLRLRVLPPAPAEEPTPSEPEVDIPILASHLGVDFSCGDCRREAAAGGCPRKDCSNCGKKENFLSEVPCPRCAEPMVRCHFASRSSLVLPKFVRASLERKGEWDILQQVDDIGKCLKHNCNWISSEGEPCGAEMGFGERFLHCHRPRCDRDYCKEHDLPKADQLPCQQSGAPGEECGCGSPCRCGENFPPAQDVKKILAGVEKMLGDVEEASRGIGMLQDIRDRLDKILSVRPGLYQNVTQVMLLAIWGEFGATEAGEIVIKWETTEAASVGLEVMGRALRETDATDIGHY